MKPVSAKMLLCYLEGEVTQSQAAEIEAYLADSASARRQLEGLRSMLSGLRAPDGEADRTDLVAAIRQRAVTAPAPSELPRPFWFVVAPALACLLMAIGLLRWRHVFVTDAADPAEAAFRAKGGPRRADDPDRWVGVQAHTVDGAGAPHPLGARLARQDGLAFAYTSIAPEPHRYLMIFGVDSASNVFWFYPAHEQAGDDPVSIAIESGHARELPEVIHQDLRAGSLTLYGVFSRSPFRVSQVEALLRDPATARGAGPPRRLSLPDTAQSIRQIQVE